MSVAIAQNWREIFALAAEAKAAKHWEEKMKNFYELLDREKDKKHKHDEKEAKAIQEFEEAIATSAQIAEFNTRLDDYDARTVEALMENRKALDGVRDDLRRMTENAYVLPDGRRVFKTADGRQVFDEHGLEVTMKTIDPDAIGDNHPTWEKYKAASALETELTTEQHALLDFQAKVDQAREHANKDDITKKELDDLGADLQAAAPPTVLEKLGLTPPEAERHAKPQLDDSTLLQPAALIDSLSRRVQPQPAPF